MVIDRRRRPPSGNFDHNVVALALALFAYFAAFAQVYMYGHLRTLAEARGNFVYSGWFVTLVAAAGVFYCLRSARELPKGSLKIRIGSAFLLPLAASLTIFGYSLTVMLTSTTVVLPVESAVPWARSP